MQIWNKVLYLGINSECEIILGLRGDNVDGNLNSAFSSSIAALAGGELPLVACLMRGRFLSSIAALAGAILTGLPAAPLCGASRHPFEGHYPSDYAPLSRG
jgi:hypothetical protein